MPLIPGQVVKDRYRVVKLLAQGGMGAVYRAWDVNLQKAVALKENLEFSQASQKQFNLEANLLANLNHPGLPHVTDYFVQAGQGQYLVMDYIEGDDLETLIERQGRLPLAQALDWIIQICKALEYLHAQHNPVIHRDIKPANIKIRPDGSALLVDFGIAKLYTVGHNTTVGAKAVTPGFSPPEQYVGMTDARTDIYALGATLYALLTAVYPPESAALATGSETLVAPRNLNPAIPPGVEAAILNAMQVETGKRFQRVADFRLALTAQSTPPSFSGQSSFSGQPSFSGKSAVEATMIASAAPQFGATPYVNATQMAPSFTTPPQPQYGAAQGYGATPQYGATPPYSGPPPAQASSAARSSVPLLAIFIVLCLLGGAMGLFGLYLQTHDDPATPTPTWTATMTPEALRPSPTLSPSPTAPELIPPSATPPADQPPEQQPTSPPPPTAPPTAPPPAVLGPATLYLDQKYNCRGGPGSTFELIWTFDSGLSLEIIGKEPTSSWWLIRINDDRTRRQQCWIGGGQPSGDLDAVPYSDWTGTPQTAIEPWP